MKEMLKMSLDLNGWDMDDVHKEMRGKAFFEILSLYKEKQATIDSKAIEYFQAMKDGSEKAKERLEKEVAHLTKEKCVIAIHITDELTKVNKN
jgi:hypothetical protein